jgi:hypothetical protein
MSGSSISFQPPPQPESGPSARQTEGRPEPVAGGQVGAVPVQADSSDSVRTALFSARTLAALQAGITRLVQESDLDGLQAYLAREIGLLLDAEACALALITAPSNPNGSGPMAVNAEALTGAASERAGQISELDSAQNWLLCKTVLNLPAPGRSADQLPGKASNERYEQVGGDPLFSSGRVVSSATLFFNLQGPGLVKECLRTGEPAWSNDIPADARYDPKSDGVNYPVERRRAAGERGGPANSLDGLLPTDRPKSAARSDPGI